MTFGEGVREHPDSGWEELRDAMSAALFQSDLCVIDGRRIQGESLERLRDYAARTCAMVALAHIPAAVRAVAAPTKGESDE